MAPDTNGKRQSEWQLRDCLSLIFSVASIVGILLLSGLVIWKANDKDTAKFVLTTLLPLFGAWVGTILAFYFGKENFEAASRSITTMAKTLSPDEQLKSIPVKEKMRPRDKMLVETQPADKIVLSEILTKMTSAEKGERLPVLTDQDYPKYMVHRSAIEKYLTGKALGDNPPKQEELKKLTLQDLLNEDAELKKLLETSFSTIKEDATLADAKMKMDPSLKIQDVFVTKDGTRNAPVIGWITNSKIQEVATV